MPSGSGEDVKMLGTAGLSTASENWTLTVLRALSVTVAVNEAGCVVTVVAIPVIAPFEASDRPAGRDPPVIVQV
jgi:hypothetical protein